MFGPRLEDSLDHLAGLCGFGFGKMDFAISSISLSNKLISGLLWTTMTIVGMIGTCQKKIQAKLDMTVLNQQFGKDSAIVKWVVTLNICKRESQQQFDNHPSNSLASSVVLQLWMVGHSYPHSGWLPHHLRDFKESLQGRMGGAEKPNECSLRHVLINIKKGRT